MVHPDDGVERRIQNGAGAPLFGDHGAFHALATDELADVVSNSRHGAQ
jgi:hypothetical protein